LPINDVTSLSISKSGRVYAGTKMGVALLDGNTWNRVQVGTLITPSIYRLLNTGDSLWVGTDTDGLWGLANNTWKHYDPNTVGNGILGFGKDSRDSIYRLDKFGRVARWTGSNWNV
jgi:hypothetical protein